MNTTRDNIDFQEDWELKKFYDAFCWVLDYNTFFSCVNSLEPTSDERWKLNLKISDFESFSERFWVIKKWTAYYVVDDTKSNWKLVESLNPIDENIIITYVSEEELRVFSINIDEMHWNVKQAIRKLLDKKN